MKTLATAAALPLLLYMAATSGADPEVRVVRLGVDISHHANVELISKTIALLQSCTANSSAAAGSHAAWLDALGSESLVHVKFAAPRKFELEGRTVMVDEILAPLPANFWPSYVFVRSGHAVLAYAHYQPLALKDLSWSRPLALGTELPYRGLANLSDD